MTLLRRVAAGVLLFWGAGAHAHEGDSESRAMQFHALLGHMDRQLAQAAGAPDPDARRAAIARHGELLGRAQELLRDAADQSPCVMMEARDAARQLACLVDTEARLRMTDRLLEQLLRREAAREGVVPRDGH